MALTADRNYKVRAGGDLRMLGGTLKIAANVDLFHGALAMKAGTGLAFVAPATAGGGQVLGYNKGAEVDNTGGAEGALEVPDLECGRVLLKNSGTDPITNAQVGRVVYVEDDQTVQAGGANPAGICMEVLTEGVYVYVDPVATALALAANANVTSGQTGPGNLIAYVFQVPDAATGDIDIIVDRKIEVVDVTVQKQNGAGAGNTMQVKNAAAAISDAIAAAVDNTITRAGTIDDANSTIAAGGTLRLTATRAAGTRNALVIVHAIPRA